MLAPGAGAALSLPAEFEELALAEDLELPSDVAFAPDGRMFVSELAGAVKVVNPGEAPLARRLLDISDHVNSYHDRGLLGIAVDVDFATNGYLYLLYTYDPDPAHPTTPKVGRLTRVKVNPDNTVANPEAPETVILGKLGPPCPPPANDVDCIRSEEPLHGVGDVESAADGTLLVSSGDGLSSSGPREHAFDTYDVTSLSGKILRVDRDGRGVPGHPFCPGDDDLDHACTKMHAVGVRNAYRVTIDHLGRVFTGDVGWDAEEEVDLVPAGANLGWPCWEGRRKSTAFDIHSFCLDFYETQVATPPIHSYATRLDGTGGSVTVGPLLRGAAYPESARDRLYFGDYVKGFVHRLRLDAAGQATAVEPFATGFHGTILEESPAGELVTGSLFDGTISRVAHAPDNRTPLARAQATPRWGAPPLEVSFRGSDSTDPDGDPLTFHWDFGDGAESTQADPVHVYEQAGSRVARLTVSDGERSATRAVSVSPGDSPPSIASVQIPSTYEGGERLELAVDAQDAQDGALGGTAVRWQVLLRHQDHLHHLLTRRGPTTWVEVGDDHDADSHLEVTVTVTDSAGLTAEHRATIRPRTAPLLLDSVPPGAALTYGSREITGPFSGVAAIGFTPVITAAESLTHEGRAYRFVWWSNGGGRIQQVRVPPQGLHLTATYQPDPAAAPAGGGSPLAGAARAARRAPVLGGRSTIAVRAGRGSAELRCRAAGPPCRGRLLVEGRSRRRWVVLARRAYALAAGTRRRVTFRLNPRARRLLERRGRLHVRLRAVEHARVPAAVRRVTLRAVPARPGGRRRG